MISSGCVSTGATRSAAVAEHEDSTSNPDESAFGTRYTKSTRFSQHFDLQVMFIKALTADQ